MKTHKMCGTREYYAWQNMKKRCLNPNDIRFHRYGGRGITVCERWLESFENFFADMGMSNGGTIDRIDNNGNYEPSNCQWIPQAEQAKKTSRIRYLEYKGEKLSLADWARKIGVKENTLTMRLNTYGWSIEKALSKGDLL